MKTWMPGTRPGMTASWGGGNSIGAVAPPADQVFGSEGRLGRSGNFVALNVKLLFETFFG